MAADKQCNSVVGTNDGDHCLLINDSRLARDQTVQWNLSIVVTACL